MCWGGREPFPPGLLIGETQPAAWVGTGGSGEDRSKFWKVLSPSVIIQDHRNRDLPKRSAPVLTAPGSASQEVRLQGKTGMLKGDSIFACPGLGNTAGFLVSLPLCKLPTLSPETLHCVPVRHWRSWYQALRTGRRARLGSHTADRWDTRSCACHTWYRLPCGHTPTEHSQWVSPCRSCTGSPPGWVALLPLGKHKAVEGQSKCGGGRAQAHYEQTPKSTHLPWDAKGPLLQ